jgi:hypothetical protein
MRTAAEENKIHAYTTEGEGCCKVCWNWMKNNIPLNVEEKKE